MRALLCVLAVLAAVVSAKHRESMLESNRILPERDPLSSLSDTCTECQSLVKRLVELIDNPQAMAEFKLLLGALCHETSYSEECRLFVSKIDVFIKKFEPYLRDPKAVCHKMNLCSNQKLEIFHRIGLLYLREMVDKANGVKDFVCDECQLAIIEAKKYIDSEQYRKETKDFISDKICKNLGKYQGSCDLVLEEFLPEIWQELDQLFGNPKLACGQLGFCQSSFVPKNKQYTSKQSLQDFWKKSSLRGGKRHGTMLISCFECKVAADTLIYSIDTPETQQSLADDLRNGACPMMPEHLYDGCEDFLTRFAPTVVAMTVKQVDSEMLCEALKMCDPETTAIVKNMKADEIEGAQCEMCQVFSEFMEYEITQPDFKDDLIVGVQNHICPRAKGFKNLCENFAQSFLPIVVDKMAKKFAKTGDFCTKNFPVC